MAKLDLSDFEREAVEALEEMAEDVEAEVEGILDEAGEDLLSRLHRDSPRKTGQYAAGWAETRETRVGGTVRIIRNEDKPQLTHLLEYGRRGAAARPHIRPSLEAVSEDMNTRLEQLKTR